MNLKSSWSHVLTVPALPVVHGTTLALNCPQGFLNLVGKTAKCLYGQVAPTNGPPDCGGEKKEQSHSNCIVETGTFYFKPLM